jgi:hypothetical protein
MYSKCPDVDQFTTNPLLTGLSFSSDSILRGSFGRQPYVTPSPISKHSSSVSPTTSNEFPDVYHGPTNLLPTDLSPSGGSIVNSPFERRPYVTPSPSSKHSSSVSPTIKTTNRITQISLDGGGVNQRQVSPQLPKLSEGIPIPLSFRHFDPSDPQTCKTEKRHRDQAELDQQKEDVAALKAFGGSCIWCTRTKKKCEPVIPCRPCISHGRICYRSAAQLLREISLENPELPSQEMRWILALLNQSAFLNSQQFNATISVLAAHGATQWTWNVTKLNTIWSSGWDYPIESLVDVIVESQSLNLTPLELAYGTHPLVYAAIKMAKLFAASQWLLQTQVVVQPADTAGGKIALLYILTICFDRLCRSSGPFCKELFYALRKPQSKAKDELDSVWVAVALYYRVTCGMRDLQNNLVVGKFLGSGYHIDRICEAMEKLLWAMIPRRGATNLVTKKNVLRDMIPTLRPDTDIIMELWQDMRPNDLQMIPPRLVEYFLLYEFSELGNLPEGAASNGSGLFMTMSQPENVESLAQIDMEVPDLFVNQNSYPDMGQDEGLGSSFGEQLGLLGLPFPNMNWQ